MGDLGAHGLLQPGAAEHGVKLVQRGSWSRCSVGSGRPSLRA
jgi:hypothetical protein